MNAEMLLQMLSGPNHVILLYRGGAEAFLYQVSHSLPALVGGGGVEASKLIICSLKEMKF